MKNLKVLIVEDQVLIAEDLKDALLSFHISQITLAHNKEKAMNKISSFQPDMALLDIRMETDTDGLDIGEHLAEINIPFIYITAHSDVEMIKKITKTSPAAYLTKPYKESELYGAIALVAENIKRKQETSIIIKDGNKTVFVHPRDVLCIKAEGNYIFIYTAHKKYLLRTSLEKFLIESLNENFVKTHRSYIVNIAKVKRYTKKEIFLDNNTVVPISRTLGDNFEQKIKSL